MLLREINFSKKGRKKKPNRNHKPFLSYFLLLCISTVLCLVFAKMNSDTSGMCMLNF